MRAKKKSDLVCNELNWTEPERLSVVLSYKMKKYTAVTHHQSVCVCVCVCVLFVCSMSNYVLITKLLFQSPKPQLTKI